MNDDTRDARASANFPTQDIGFASVDGRSLYNYHLPDPFLQFGPFHSIHDFHLPGLIKQHGGHWHIVFIHCDLRSLNVLVRGDKFVELVDWETAGWYPSYWEYTTALSG